MLLCFLCCRSTIHTIAQRIFGHISASISKPRPYLFSLVTHPDLRNKKDIFAALSPPQKKRKSISNILKRNFQEELGLKSILERVNNCPMSSPKWDSYSCYHSFQGLGDIMEDRKEYAQHCL